MTLGEKIQRLRTDAGLSQEELAARLQVSRQAISKWELDKTVPDVKYIVELSELFRTSTDYLLKNTASAPAAPLPPPSAGSSQSAPPPRKPRDASPLIAALLFCGDGLLVMLSLLHFPMLFFFAYRLSFIPLFLVIVLAPIFFLTSRVFLRTPAQSLGPYRHAAAGCLTAWGFAIALLMGYSEVIDDLLFMQVEGLFSIPLLLVLTAALLGGLYTAGYLLARWSTKSIRGN